MVILETPDYKDADHSGGFTSGRGRGRLKYLEHIARKLKKAGIITSFRGQRGGHRLSKSPDDISIGHIVRILEESVAIIDCAEQNNQVCGACSRAGECLSRWVWTEASRVMFDRLDEITIASLLAMGNEQFKRLNQSLAS